MARRHRRHANPFARQTWWPPAADPPVATAGRAAPWALDIGCGAGAFTLALARAHPEWNVLGLEIRPHLVAAVNARMAGAGLSHGRAVMANANLHLPALVAPASVAFVALNFPDPWYKKRHHKRRVVSPAWLTMLATYLMPGAELHIMTDYLPLADSILKALAASGYFASMHPAARFAAASTTGIASERETKHLGRGEQVYRLQEQFLGAA